jgi:hypothetical protein
VEELAVKPLSDGVVFTAKVVPGSSKTSLCGLLDGMLKIKVAAAPEKGKANKCLIELLAAAIGVKKNAVSIVSGQSHSVKHIQVLGVSKETLLKKLGL